MNKKVNIKYKTQVTFASITSAEYFLILDDTPALFVRQFSSERGFDEFTWSVDVAGDVQEVRGRETHVCVEEHVEMK